MHQITRRRCGEIEDVHGCAGRSQVTARAYVQNLDGVRFDFMGVVYRLRKGRESHHEMWVIYVHVTDPSCEECWYSMTDRWRAGGWCVCYWGDDENAVMRREVQLCD